VFAPEVEFECVRRLNWNWGVGESMRLLVEATRGCVGEGKESLVERKGLFDIDRWKADV
jgi:hypothetical protein